MTVQELLAKSVPWLAGKGVEAARLDAELLLAKALSLKRLDLYLQFDRPLSVAEQDSYRELAKRRATGEPVAYLVGSKGFWKSDFAVSPEVLIPRPETELLVEKALARAPRDHAARILEMGTGSGCVAVSLALELPEATVIAVDVSEAALAVARRNVERLAPGRVDLRAGDAFAAIGAEDRFDLVVANPPYVADGDLPRLARDVREFEPRAALLAGSDGLSFVRAWSKGAAAHLSPGGWCLFEIGIGEGEGAVGAFREAGLVEVALAPDLAGIPRVVSGRRASG